MEKIGKDDSKLDACNHCNHCMLAQIVYSIVYILPVCCTASLQAIVKVKEQMRAFDFVPSIYMYIEGSAFFGLYAL